MSDPSEEKETPPTQLGAEEIKSGREQATLVSESPKDRESTGEPTTEEGAEEIKPDQEQATPVSEPPKDGESAGEPTAEEGVAKDEGQTSEGTPTATEKQNMESESATAKQSEEADTETVKQKTDSLPAPQPVKQPTYRHDWYQTESNVCVNIMIKKLKKDNVKVDIKETTVKVQIKLDGSKKYNLELNLAHPIVPKKSNFTVLSTKVEIKLRKSQGLQWKTLEAADKSTLQENEDVSKRDSKSNDPVHKYPSSSHYTRDWDKLVAEVKDEEKNEKPEGDAALNKLFQQIYRDGSDEVKKAMNKSFVESGGTVLSTNWGDVGKDKVERKPPDGMEWKEYEN